MSMAGKPIKQYESFYMAEMEWGVNSSTNTTYMNYEFDIFTFSILAVLVQLVFDFLFYLIFMAVPKGHNHMLDLFKDWAKFAKADALWGDSILVIVGVILSSFLNQQSFDFNIFTLIFSVYLVPYIIYMKD